MIIQTNKMILFLGASLQSHTHTNCSRFTFFRSAVFCVVVVARYKPHTKYASVTPKQILEAHNDLTTKFFFGGSCFLLLLSLSSSPRKKFAERLEWKMDLLLSDWKLTRKRFSELFSSSQSSHLYQLCTNLNAIWCRRIWLFYRNFYHPFKWVFDVADDQISTSNTQTFTG